MPNKLVVQQVQTIIHALSHQELDRLFLLLQKISNNQIKKTSKLVGYKCHETLIHYTTIEATGFGRDEAEASVNCIKNFIDVMLEQEDINGDHYNVLKSALKELRDPGSPANDSNYSSLCNNSFDQNLEGLSKKIGNISMIKNSKVPSLNDNTLCLEGEDLILKEMKQNQQMYESPKKIVKQQQKEKFESSVEKLESLQFQRQSIEEPFKKKSMNKNELLSSSQQKENYHCQKYCGHEQELKNERLKVEHLELRMKLILEENRILKSMINDQRNITQQENIQTNNKSQRNHHLTKQKESEFQVIMSERNQSSKSRTTTTSADDTKRFPKSNPSQGQGISKQLQIQLALDRVPKLNLDVLPNYHAKQPGGSINQYLLNMYSNKHKVEQIF